MGRDSVIVIVDYGMGNTGSIMNMLRRLGVGALLTSDPKKIVEAERLIIPGVGAFDQGITAITERGLRPPLDRVALELGRPILGICLGTQLLGRASDEGNKPGLGWIGAQSRRLKPAPEANRIAKVPHMGWNYAAPVREHPLFKDTQEDARYYFVHSYHVVCDRPEDVIATSWYGGETFASAIGRDNIAGVQFHPEKSHRFGMQVLRNFAAWCPDTVAQ